jgi:peroxiredoxin Q/BCP
MRLEPGDAAPAFNLRDEQGNAVTLDQFSGRGLILYFYPKAFTPGCTTESCDFRDRSPELTSAGYEVIGVSPDPVERLAAFKAEYGLPYRLVADEDHAVAEAYGAWGLKTNYGKQYEGIIRSTFVIGADGTVERAWYAVQAGGHVDRVVRDLVVAP